MSARMGQRRRGKVLEAAIYDAVLTELATVGYGRLTMEGIAARAGTAKSSLYRRWSSVEGLVLDAVHGALPDPAAVPETGDLRAELIVALTRMAETMQSPVGRGVATILNDFEQSRELLTTAREKIVGPRLSGLHTIFERAAARGEIRLGAVTPFVVQAGPAIVTHSCLVQALTLSPEDIENIVDQVILPVVSPRRAPNG